MNTLKFLAFGLALCFFLSFPKYAASATLTGPDEVKVGELVTVQCDEQGEWIITPVKGVTIAKDTGGKLLYFVASSEGDYTIIFFGVKDNKPVLTQKSIEVGKGGELNPNPDPSPTPDPEPDPDPSPVVKTLSDVEREAAVYAVDRVLTSIEAETVQTPQGARSVFKQALYNKGRVCNGRTCSLPANLQTLTNQWTEKADFSTLETTKNSFESFKKELDNN